ncbi:MAG: nitronate monooxygenase family protein, partial [Oscillospiraceae bacterium]|nr:nitronate monooxygenase family protein [Oscillospiraceae bacterium]
MKLTGIKIGEKTSKYPIIQGGMGVGVSGYKLAGNVAKNGGIGMLSSAGIGYRELDFDRNAAEANLRAMNTEIDRAREIAGESGIIGVNVMVALTNHADMVKQVVKKGVDLIVSGAGLPRDLPKLVEGSKTKIAPIISSARGAALITKMWVKKYNYVPDMIIVEGPEAGGHLGFSNEELTVEGKKKDLETITKEVFEEVKKVEKETNKRIPVIVAGGIYDGKDIAKFLKMGATGVQMGTRFIATEECDASEEYKQTYINAKKEDVHIIKSPVGMPGRAIRNKFLEITNKERQVPTRCVRCIHTCDVETTPYCITKALLNAVKGNIDEALLFCGSNVHKIKEMVSVKNLMDELVNE